MSETAITLLAIGGAIIVIGYAIERFDGWKKNRRFNQRLKAMKDQF